MQTESPSLLIDLLQSDSSVAIGNKKGVQLAIYVSLMVDVALYQANLGVHTMM